MSSRGQAEKLKNERKMHGADDDEAAMDPSGDGFELLEVFVWIIDIH